MNRCFTATFIAAGLVSVNLVSPLAQSRTSQPLPTAGSPIHACSLLPKEEVKKQLPWLPVLDQMRIEEEPIGAAGSSCNYPSVMIQVLPFSQRMIDIARNKGGLEPISNVGDEAYFHNNANEYAELYVRSGKHLLTLQANWDGKVGSVKSGVVNLAKALVVRLR